jgi:hypothetical protein
VFDEDNLIADAGLVPVVRLAERAGLPELVDTAVRISGSGNGGGANPAAKVMSLVAAMCAGADSIDDTDRLRHGAAPTAFGGVRASSTLGTFLRSFTHGHDPAPAPQLALGRRLAAVVRHPPHPTRQPLTCRHPPPERARPEPNTWKSRADQPLTPARGRATTRPSYRKGRKMSLDSQSVDRG